VRDLICKAQAGDKPALTRLIEKFHRLVLKIATPYAPDPAVERQAAAWGLSTRDGPEFDDLVAVGVAELTKAILRFNLRRNNGLFAYVETYIRGAISKEARDSKKRGTSGETRIERWV
jgi:DNA-directed RNA polymerase specialized sigma subunit